MRISAPRQRARKLKATWFLFSDSDGALLCFSACVFWTAFTYASMAGSCRNPPLGLPAVLEDSPGNSIIHVQIVLESEYSSGQEVHVTPADLVLTYIWMDKLGIDGRVIRARELGRVIEQHRESTVDLSLKILLVVPDSAAYGEVLTIIDEVAAYLVTIGDSDVSLSSAPCPARRPMRI